MQGAVPENIHTHPLQKGSDFPRWRGVNLPNFPGGTGYTIGKYFKWVLVARKRVPNKKHKSLPH